MTDKRPITDEMQLKAHSALTEFNFHAAKLIREVEDILVKYMPGKGATRSALLAYMASVVASNLSNNRRVMQQMQRKGDRSLEKGIDGAQVAARAAAALFVNSYANAMEMKERNRGNS